MFILKRGLRFATILGSYLDPGDPDSQNSEHGGCDPQSETVALGENGWLSTPSQHRKMSCSQ